MLDTAGGRRLFGIPLFDLIIAALVVLGLVLTVAKEFSAIKDILARYHLPDWLPLALTAAAALVKVVVELIKWLKGYSKESRDRKQKIDALLHQWPLRAVATVDPYDDLGVFRSKIADRYRTDRQAPPYIPRDADGRLDAALLRFPSSSSSGRQVGEVSDCLRSLSSTFRRPAAHHPRRAEQAPRVVPIRPAPAPGPPPGVLWLDDLDRYLDAGSLNATMLRAWADSNPRVVAVATIREREHDRLITTEGDLGRRARDVLHFAEAREAEIVSHQRPAHQNWPRPGPSTLIRILPTGSGRTSLLRANCERSS